MKIVGRIGQVETDNGDRPVDDVKISSSTVKNLMDSTYRYSVDSDMQSSVPINMVTYCYSKPENMNPFVISEGQELDRNQRTLLTGPRNEPNALRGILEKMKAKL